MKKLFAVALLSLLASPALAATVTRTATACDSWARLHEHTMVGVNSFPKAARVPKQCITIEANTKVGYVKWDQDFGTTIFYKGKEWVIDDYAVTE
jgi:hypothetical protein